MNVSNNSPTHPFTRLYARIVEEDGAFTVSVRMLNHLNQQEFAFGQKTAATFDIASGMIGGLADEFKISQGCITIKIIMGNFKDGTLH